MPELDNITLVMTSVGTEQQAVEISEELISRRLATCINIVPCLRSIYRWKGKVCEDTEYLLLIKTPEKLFDDVSSAIREFEGINVGHTVRAVLRRDSRDRIFNPTEGSDNSLSIEHAGMPFGGDIGFTKYVADSGWYIPLFWDTVGVLHGSVGFIHGDFIGKVPVWERFALGGMNSVRGYDWRDISPRDEAGNKIGGNKMVQFNVELLFPLVKQAGLMGVLFYDMGNAYDNGEDIDLAELRSSAGYGFRWFSPIGPIRLEYGYILDDKEGKKGKSRWEFTMGTVF